MKTNYKFIEYTKSFGLTLINKLNKSSTNAKTQVAYCFTNMKDLESDYCESLTSFHKPIWIRKQGSLTEFHADQIKQIRTDICFNLKDLKIYDQSDMMQVDEEFFFDCYEIDDENEQINVDRTFNLEDLHTSDQSDMMDIDEQSSSENYEIIDSNSRKMIKQFLCALDLNNTTDIDQISSQAKVINDLIEKLPFITVQNRDQSIRLQSSTRYSVQAFDSVYARTYTTADGNCLYSSLSIINIGSEKLTHSMRLLAVNAMINNSDYFRTVCESLLYSFEEQLEKTALNTIWGGEVQLQALSVALSHPIYSYSQFNNDPNKPYYVPSNISLQVLIDRFNKHTAGSHIKYIGHKSDINKLGFCVYYNGVHYDALLPREDNPQQFVPHCDLISMRLSDAISFN